MAAYWQQLPLVFAVKQILVNCIDVKGIHPFSSATISMLCSW
ncbi:hypothetical protein HMPREF9997_01017 [Corynebacterium durum F0235]|uniref:Uncharacterized protein n=1 Tax=Corynebacterium durum F0235 TaxID=1035195 RepID=L1MJ53_9CORY|nr:hypothetical protein HMPREF9997_01017 [Corynebacterium durum F0235]